MPMYIRNIEITTREIVMCIPIAILLIALCTFIYHKVKISSDDNIATYTKALSCDTLDDFKFAYDTGIGDVFTNFNIKTITPQSIPELKGQFLYIEKVREDYVMHTTTTCDSNGKCTTTTYWSWDYSGSDEWISPTLLLNTVIVESKKVSGYDPITLNVSKKNVSPEYHKMLSWLNTGYLYKNSSTRFYYNVVPLEISGAVFLTLDKENIVSEQIKLFRDTQQTELRQRYINSENYKLTILIIISAISILAILILFVAFENKWLNGTRNYR